jgi:hypothetical protein
MERPLASHIQRSNKISRNALGFDEERFREQFSPEVWITAYPVPFEIKELVLER